ncbi:methyltransferase domain-containing protein [Colletotrichum karsti]|uniref:Methyltransferase domain-containing protein n=1 Tax=Colletotrichum karsti TaxID=1095194 RepID=A0A9P6LHT2_9PEZI|nr:methyltransferase domain-containing protein [Colletotrichum karsti]KAF9872897.1 methyltransferase domain-containing protein [Colletotrichum karsti]
MSATSNQAAVPPSSSLANADTGPHEGPITAGPAIDETNNESETRSIISSSTASLTESITEYRRLHGRTYTQKTDYWGPNDEKQNEGLEINHYWMTLFLGDKLFLAPIGDSPQNVLDLGTGTGIWAIDFADEFPSAEVVGIDISPIQPSWVPPNCKFQIGDIEQPWTWPADFFDLVHIRNLEGSVADWPALYNQAIRSLRPGGYIEVKEFDIEVRSQVQDVDDDHPYKAWARNICAACDKLGKTGKQCREPGIATNLREAGFIDIIEKKWPIPIGAWANDPMLKEVGTGALEYLDQSLEGFGTFLLKEILGWEYAKAIVFISEKRRALKDAKMQPVIDL